MANSKPAVRRVALSSLVLDEQNANNGTKRGQKMLSQSLEKYGAGRSVLLDRRGRIIAGNKTIEAARAAGMKSISVIETDGSSLISVKRGDLDLKRDKKARELAIADNRVSELDLEWDAEALSKLDVDLKQFWNDAELRKLVGGEALEAPEPQFDKAAQLQRKWKTARGQIWQIGEHRLMCGDSLKQLPELMGDHKARLLLTDPPYNVGIFGGTHDPRDAANYRMGKWKGNVMENDLMDDDQFDTFLLALFRAAKEVMNPGAAFYICSPAGRTETQFRNAIDKVFALRQCIVWVKQQFVFGRQDYHWRHESILYGWKEGTHYFADDKTQDTVWEMDRPLRSDMKHPTVKPPDLFAKAIRNSSKVSDIVLDVCTGSGTSFCASESLQRICYGMEIEPKYVAVALERLSEMGLKPKLCGNNGKNNGKEKASPARPRARQSGEVAARAVGQS